MTGQVPRVVVVTRRTEYASLLERHATRGQADFFLRTRGQRLEPVEATHHAFEAALSTVLHCIPAAWRHVRVDRSDLYAFVFEPEDIVVALGQDGLVANVAKYLDGQAVIGLNPLPELYDGILVPHAPDALGDLLDDTLRGRVPIDERTMVEALLDDGQALFAVNEVFVGHRSHQSARYEICWGERSERHSSSGVVVATGTGATGWARSIHRERRSELSLPTPTARSLVYFVREAFPSVATGTDLTEGRIDASGALRLRSEMNSGGVLFGDGVEEDGVAFRFGQQLEVRPAERSLRCVASAGGP